MKFISGYKTYICAGALAVVTFAFYMKWIDLTTFGVLEGFLVSLGGMAMRSAIKKAG